MPQERNDEAVLGAYPSTIRRRVLRYLYLDVLQVGWYQCICMYCTAAESGRSWRGIARQWNACVQASSCDAPPAASSQLHSHTGSHSADLPLACATWTYPQACQLFGGARQRFLDALLAAARVEVYLPNVRVLYC